MEPIYSEANDNQVFNPSFVFSNRAGSFPEGWHKCRGRKTARFFWDKDEKQNNYIRIKNRFPKNSATIIQDRSYVIPVYEKQVWEVGAILKADRKLLATIKVHYIAPFSSRVLNSSLCFKLDSKCEYYLGIVTVPAGVDYARLEIGTLEAGTLWIESVSCRRVFPVDKYDRDGRGRLNINSVQSVKRIIETVDVKGKFDLVRQIRDFTEDLTADSSEKTSTMQDVFYLATYSFCVINQGCAAAILRIQLSPNGVDWVEDRIADDYVGPGQMAILVYNRFARYVRLKYWAEDGSTSLKIYFQGQG